MMKKTALSVCVLLFAMTAFGYWRYRVGAQNRPVAQFAFIQDPSDSISTDCDRTIALVERALVNPDVGEGSTITMFALGDERTANEPRWLGQFNVPVIKRVIEGQRTASRAKQDLLSNVRARCADVKQTRRSPIFIGLKRGVEHLRAVGAPEDPRYLFIQTDGEEFDNKQIMEALNQRPGARSGLPSAIDNTNVRVTFCGLAETVGEIAGSDHRMHHKSHARDEAHADRLREVWSRLFSKPELVTFEPYCSR